MHVGPVYAFFIRHLSIRVAHVLEVSLVYA